jgi:UDP-N-acetylmuramyl tripeptide synthase
MWRLGGITAIVDFAHNPHGLAALTGMVAAMDARRRAIVIGQAGDRDDD